MKWITLAVFFFFVLCTAFLNYDFEDKSDPTRDAHLGPNPGRPDLHISLGVVELNVNFEGLGLWLQQVGEMDSDQVNSLLASFGGWGESTFSP